MTKESKMISSLYSTTLAQMYKCSFDNDIEQYKILKSHLDDLIIEELDSDDHMYLRAGIILECMNNFKSHTTPRNNNKTTSEYSTVHTWVRRNMAELIGLKVVDKFSSLESGRRPDFLVLDDEVRYPVECKKVFNKRSLNQLEQYMIEMGVNKGYAVAPKLTIKLPDNIIFIQSDEV